MSGGLTGHTMLSRWARLPSTNVSYILLTGSKLMFPPLFGRWQCFCRLPTVATLFGSLRSGNAWEEPGRASVGTRHAVSRMFSRAGTKAGALHH